MIENLSVEASVYMDMEPEFFFDWIEGTITLDEPRFNKMPNVLARVSYNIQLIDSLDCDSCGTSIAGHIYYDEWSDRETYEFIPYILSGESNFCEECFDGEFLTYSEMPDA